MAKTTTADSGRSAVAPTAARSQAAAPHATAAAPAASTQDSEPSPKARCQRSRPSRQRPACCQGIDAGRITRDDQGHRSPAGDPSAPGAVQRSATGCQCRRRRAEGIPRRRRRPSAPDLAASQLNAPDQPLKILTINLEPPALGNVTVRLRLVGNEVSVDLAAERKDTSQMLDQQRDSTANSCSRRTTSPTLRPSSTARWMDSRAVPVSRSRSSRRAEHRRSRKARLTARTIRRDNRTAARNRPDRSASPTRRRVMTRTRRRRFVAALFICNAGTAAAATDNARPASARWRGVPAARNPLGFSTPSA